MHRTHCFLSEAVWLKSSWNLMQFNDCVFYIPWGKKSNKYQVHWCWKSAVGADLCPLWNQFGVHPLLSCAGPASLRGILFLPTSNISLLFSKLHLPTTCDLAVFTQKSCSPLTSQNSSPLPVVKGIGNTFGNNIPDSDNSCQRERHSLH